jgi:HPt (histidine-containing phosphotransfer) domain-containing protein
MWRGNIADEVDLPEPAGLDQEVFNERTLLERLMEDRQLAGIVLQAFLQDFPGQLEDLGVRFGEHDESGIRFRVHTLKGAAAAVSATRLRAVLAEMERAVATSRIDDCAVLLSRVNREFLRFRKSIEGSGWVGQRVGMVKGKIDDKSQRVFRSEFAEEPCRRNVANSSGRG